MGWKKAGGILSRVKREEDEEEGEGRDWARGRFWLIEAGGAQGNRDTHLMNAANNPAVHCTGSLNHPTWKISYAKVPSVSYLRQGGGVKHVQTKARSARSFRFVHLASLSSRLV